MSHIDEIVQEARSFIGQQEIPPNLGFKNPDFDKKMKAVGFYRGASWCGFFVMLVLFDVYKDQPEILKYLKKYASPSTHQMWANFRASKEVITGQVPKLGAVVIWQEGSGSNGHTGIVVSVDADGKHFTSVEGNTSLQGSREGLAVGENRHTLGLPHNEHGLNLLGFCYMTA
jgi:hypothetical protein